MKKSIVMAVCATLLAGTISWGAGPVYSVNAVGYMSVNLQAGAWKLLSMQFDKLDGTTTVASDVISDPTGTGLTNGFSVLLWNGISYVSEDYYWGYGFYPNTNKIVRGSGMWVKSPLSITVNIMGQVPSTNATTTALGPQWNLISFPYPAAVAISNSVLQLTGTAGDSILGVLPSGGYTNADFYSGYGWYPGDFMLKPGEGYWYKSVASASTNWVQPKPYIWP